MSNIDFTTFWAIRLTIVSVSSCLCFFPIVIIFLNKLQNRLPMLYAAMIAISQAVLCISALVFGVISANLNLP